MSDTPSRTLTAKQVRAMFGDVSDMSLWRWLNDPQLSFPKPIVVNRRRYWRESDIAAFQARHSAAAA